MKKKKAVLVTKDNAANLSGRFFVDTDAINDFIGFYLVADFADYSPPSFLSRTALDAAYNTTTTTMENGFFEIEAK